MDLRKHLSFIDPHSFDSKGHHSSIRDEEKPWFNPQKDPNKAHKSMIHNKSVDETSKDLSWINHSKSLKSLEKDKSPLPQRTRGYQMRRSDIGKENIVNNIPRNAKRSVEKIDATDITNKYKNLFKSYEQLVKLNILNEEALKTEKQRCEEQKRYIGTLTAIIEESISKGGLMSYFKKSFSHVNMTEDIYEHLFNVVDLHKRLQTANEVEMKLRNEMEIIKKQASEVLKRKERLNIEVSQFQKINEDIKLELQEKQKAFEDLKREKDEIHQEKRSLVEYIAILKETLAPKAEYQQTQSELNIFRERYEELRKELNELENKNTELNNQKISALKDLEEKNNLVQQLEKNNHKLFLELNEKEKEINNKGKDDKLKNEDYEVLRSKIETMEKELEKEKETRKHLEVTLASRISEAVKLQGQVDNLIQERDEEVSLIEELEEKLRVTKEENSYLRNELRRFEEENLNQEKDTRENDKIKNNVVRWLSEIKNGLVEILEKYENEEGNSEAKVLRTQLNNIKNEEIEDNFKEMKNILRFVSNEMRRLDEQYLSAKHEKEENLNKIRELELSKDELLQKLNTVEVGMVKLNKQNQKLFKENHSLTTELGQKENELKEFISKNEQHNKERESNNSQLLNDYLKCFIFNTEIIETIEMIGRNLEEIRLVDEELTNVSNSEHKMESFRDIQKSKEDLLKRNSELEKDLYDLQMAEERRYHSLYQLEKQNAELRDELNEFISTFGNQEERGFQSSEKKSLNYEARQEKDKPDISRLFADYRMPMTQIHFETEEE